MVIGRISGIYHNDVTCAVHGVYVVFRLLNVIWTHHIGLKVLFYKHGMQTILKN